ncbi:hypothetical protein KUTeg_000468 [Tegillarca granosa]|uniref:Uncharacterized protein n=1 Tax=Tegillarca granosa TaxID=220873 RepID=A0ABQ9FXK7_TEGGR|nr:hypothetical protein KUTeg_000468 [Tegillarca granosa]
MADSPAAIEKGKKPRKASLKKTEAETVTEPEKMSTEQSSENGESQPPSVAEESQDATTSDDTVVTKVTTTEEKTEFTSLEMIDDEEFQYNPPTKDNTLPDLYRLMETLESGETPLETDKEPPSLFTVPEHEQSYSKISELKLEIEKSEMKPYLDHFEEGVKDDVVMLGSISLEEVQDEEKRLRDEHIRYLDQEAQRKLEQKEEIQEREEEAKRRMAAYTKERRTEIAKREAILKQKEKLLMDRLHRAFRRAESHLISTLESRKGEVKTFFGDLMLADGQFGGSRGRRWKVEWDKTPQPIQIKLKCLRGVRDKLPGGRYVLMVSLYDRLGGHPLRWSKLKGQMWGGATLPLTHDGKFYNVEIKLDQSMFTVLPSQASLRPGMVLMYELFLLRGAVLATDRVVGWGCFPICDAQFDVIEGKYKCPFLRGEIDTNLTKHEKIEELISSDLDHWLCNMYFEIVKLPRYHAGQNEIEVELQFSSGLIGHPDRVNIGNEEYKDGEKPIPGSVASIQSDSLSAASITSPTDTEYYTDGQRSVATTVATTSKVRLAEGKNKNDLIPTTIGSRLIHRDRKLDLLIDESSDDSDDESSADNYKYNPVDIYHNKLYTMLPKTHILTPAKNKKQLTRVEQLEQHSFAVQPEFACKGRLARSNHEKLQYVGRQFLAELGLSQWRSREFWGMMLMFIVVFFLRMFNFFPYTIELNYQSTLLRTREEIGVVWLGPTMNILVFSFLVFFCWINQKLFGLFPDIGCKFIIAFGIFTFLDPLLILMVDCILQRYEQGSTEPIADCAKLYWHFYRAEGSGLAGIFITAFLYTFCMFMTASIIYMYFLRLHNNGRLLDVFWRLHGKEEKFFIPYDLEVSNQELNYIIEESIWDENGVERKEYVQGRMEITTHVSVHTIHLDGLRELYRHFLRLPDGAIVEVFGDIGIPGMDKDVKKALEKGSKGLENLMGSMGSVPNVRGRRTVNTRSGFHADRDYDTSPTPSSSGSYPEKKKML